jgi:hypothetical protein
MAPAEQTPMRTVLIRSLKSGLPTALILALLGIGYSQLSGIWLTADTSKPDDQQNLSDFTNWLQVRVAAGMAAWGFVIVFLGECFRALWLPESSKTATSSGSNPKVDADAEAERLLLQLLEEAEAAERQRRQSPPLDQTPPPRGVPSPDRVPAEAVPHG